MKAVLAVLLALVPALAHAAPEPRVGTVFPFAEIPVITQAGGKVVQVPVAEGTRVRQGQLLLSLDRTREVGEIRLLELQIAHKAALRLEELALGAARQELARDEALYQDRAVPPKTLDDSRHRVKLAAERVSVERGRIEEQKQALALKRRSLEEYDVRSPADGILASLLLHPNQVVTAGTRVGDVLVIDDVLVETFVPLPEARRLRVGGRASARPEGGAPPLAGRIKVLGQKVDPVSGSVKVRVLVPNAAHRLKPGMLVRVSL